MIRRTRLAASSAIFDAADVLFSRADRARSVVGATCSRTIERAYDIAYDIGWWMRESARVLRGCDCLSADSTRCGPFSDDYPCDCACHGVDS